MLFSFQSINGRCSRRRSTKECSPDSSSKPLHLLLSCVSPGKLSGFSGSSLNGTNKICFVIFSFEVTSWALHFTCNKYSQRFLKSFRIVFIMKYVSRCFLYLPSLSKISTWELPPLSVSVSSLSTGHNHISIVR